MKKDYRNEIKNKVGKIMNDLDDDGRAHLEELATAILEIAANADDEGKAEIMATLEEILATKFAKEKEEIIESLRKIIHNELATRGANGNPQLTKELANSVAKAILNSRGRDEVRRNVEEVLKTNGVSGLEYGEIIASTLSLKVEDANPLLGKMHVARYTQFHYGEVELDKAAQIAKQWDKDSTSDKAIQELAVNVKKIDTRYIYKRQQFANEDLDEIEEAGDLSKFIADIRAELRQMVGVAKLSAILVGDNVNTGKDRVTTFETIGTKTASDAFTTVYKDTDAAVTEFLTANGANTPASILFASARLTADSLYNPMGKETVMVMNKATLTALSAYKVAAGGDISYRSKEEVAAQIGVDSIITTDIMPVSGEGNAPLFVAMIPDGYWVKERKTIDVVYPTYEKNVQNLQYEENCGGAIHDLLSTAVFISTK